jgi:hypothetical protein
MTDERPRMEFGKRRQVTPLPPQPTQKRSGHVALLVMGTMAVGGGAYALMPGASCVPPQPAPPGMAAPAVPPSSACTSGGSSYGGGSRSWSSFHFYGGDSSGRASSAGASASSDGVTRGGFGSFAHAFGFGGG